MKVSIVKQPGGGYFWEVQLGSKSKWGYTFTNAGARRSAKRALKHLKDTS